MDDLDSAVLDAIGESRGVRPGYEGASSVGGGCIHRATRLRAGGASYFVKTNSVSASAMFAAEAGGLAALAVLPDLAVPAVVARGSAGGQAFLVLEWMDMEPLDRTSGSRLGESLAALHRLPCGEEYGWSEDNFIGATPQRNEPRRAWARFFADLRLKPQLGMARGKGMDPRLVERGLELAEKTPAFFVAYAPAPSLLHGDLWSGNAARLADGRPAIFDPAVYRGDREADLAMAELFGGFPESFYAAYRAAWPLDAGYETRKNLYNLYHVLNHYNLFGAGYLGQVRRMVEKLLAELRG